MNARFPALFAFVLLIGVFAVAQCQSPSVPPYSPKTMLSPEQESYLGELIAQSVRMELKVIEDPELTAPLERIGAHLQRYAPPESVKFQVFLVDSPVANAFTIAGGRIFVTRKALTLARSEDEVAGLLAHEMGHTLTGQIATEYRQLFRDILKADTLGGKEDVERRYHELLDKAATNKYAWSKIAERAEKDQLLADQMSVHLASRAGYTAKDFADYFDRLTQNKGKTGNWFSDFIGNTRPESKRYREILKAAGPVAQACVDKSGHMTVDAFARWKQNVISFRGFGKQEALPAGTRKQVMKDPLREQISLLRFSPDGKYILAQDGSSIYVLSREPFKALFRVDAENAQPAQFTPDSRNILFHTNGARVEKWEIASQQQTDASEIYSPTGCLQTALSPTGEYLACIHFRLERWDRFDLDVFNVASGEKVWTRKDIYSVDLYNYFFFIALMDVLRSGRPIQLAYMEFSPDGKYLLGAADGIPFAYDFAQHEEMPLAALSGIREFVKRGFTWQDNDSIFGRLGDKGEKSSVVQFPTGKVLKADIPVGPLGLYRAAKGPYVILRPILHAPIGAINLTTKQIFIGSKTPALDIYDGLIVSERVNGELGLYDKPGGKPIAVAQLPLGPITRFSAAAVSPDLKYVAYSEHNRGAVWSLQSGTRLAHVRGYRGAYFTPDGLMLATFPPPDSYSFEGAITRNEYKERSKEEWGREESKKEGQSTVRLMPGTGVIIPVMGFDRRTETKQVGPYLMVSATRDGDGEFLKSRELEVRDIVSGRTLWTRKFEKGILGGGIPVHFVNVAGGTLSFSFAPEEAEAKAIIKANPALKAKLSAMPEKHAGRLIEVVNLADGKRKAALAVDTGNYSFSVNDVDAVGDLIVVTDNNHRLMVFDSEGSRKARIFGTRPVISRDGKLMVVRLEPGRVAVYKMTNGTTQDQVFTFPQQVVDTQFSSDGSQLVVITSDQSIYTVNLNASMARQ